MTVLKRVIIYPVLAILLTLAWWIPLPTTAQKEVDADAVLFQSISGPTVKITVWRTTTDGFGEATEHKMGHGSGVIIAREKRAHFVLSAAHVSPVDAEILKVEHPDYLGGKIAHVLEIDRERDLMLLVFMADVELPIVKIAAEAPSVTAEVFLYGHGAPEYSFATKGILSAKQSAWFDAPEMWVITAQVWFGCSGGGAYDKNGELIGIVTRIRISKGMPLSWQCGIVPLPVVLEFLKKSGMAVRSYKNTELAGSHAHGGETWVPLFPIYSERQGSQ